MPRKRRRNDPGQCHHVGNRGQAHRPIFETRHDARLFLAFLARAVRRYGIEILAYTILTTHFHLLVRCPQGNLSAALRYVSSRFTRRFNHERRRDGAAFRARFWSRPTEDLGDLIQVCRYIDRNAVKAGLARVPWEYEHCSAAHYRRTEGPPWLARDLLEEQVVIASGAGGYDPLCYPPWRGDRPEDSDWLVERRQRCARRDRLGLAPDTFASDTRLEAWFANNTMRADGRVPRWPLVSPGEVLSCLAELRGGGDPWEVAIGARVGSGWDLLELVMLRLASGFTVPELMARYGAGKHKIRKLLQTSLQLAGTDPRFIAAMRSAFARLLGGSFS